MEGPSAALVRRRLLRWFDASRRDLPWRRTRDPYRILIAEILLQRTRVATGQPYYERFLGRFPDLESLAAASEEDVLRAWEGLGYYRRARNLLEAARTIRDRHGGHIPQTAAELAALPGIGPYTAGAVASIAFGERVPAVDGNATRVLARLFRVEEDVSKRPGRDRIQALAAALVPASRSGAFNQALMELGATVCTPMSPSCGLCPLAESCLARAAGVQASLPRSSTAREAPIVPVVFALVREGSRVLLVRRPTGGLLGDLWSLPGGETRAHGDLRRQLREIVSAQTGLRIRVGPASVPIAHAFSHRRWSGAIHACTVNGGRLRDGASRWAGPSELRDLPMVPFHREALRDLETRRTLDSFVAGEP